jgi:hypothetical protein
MKHSERVAFSPPRSDRRRSGTGAVPRQAAESGPTEEQAFYAAQEEAFADLRAYHAARPRRKR